MNKRLHEFFWIQVFAFNGEDEHRTKGTLRKPSGCLRNREEAMFGLDRAGAEDSSAPRSTRTGSGAENTLTNPDALPELDVSWG
jgi:hypothetical protein